MTQEITPCIVFDTETTGFPGVRRGFRARIIEVGAVVVTADRRVVSPIQFFVSQPRSHLFHPMAQRAMKVHQISVPELAQKGLAPEHAAERLADWVERVQEKHGAVEARAYNQGFDFWFMQRPPWSLFEATSLIPGEDIKESSRKVMKDAGMTKHAPPLADAVAFLADRGYPIEWQGDAHRAAEDARVAAWCALFMQEEAAKMAML